MQLDIARLEELPEVSFGNNIPMVLTAIAFTLSLLILVISATWRSNISKKMKIVIPTMIATLFVTGSTVAIAYAVFEDYKHQEMTQKRDRAMSHNRQLAEDQAEQIKHVYDMPGLNMEFAVCAQHMPTQKVDASWPGGYGSVVIGKAAGDHCQVDIFDETGKKLQPVR